jgi:hypothetical protein
VYETDKMKEANKAKQRSRELSKRSDKIKLILKSTQRTVTFLKDIDIYDSRYWQFSAAMVCRI